MDPFDENQPCSSKRFKELERLKCESLEKENLVKSQPAQMKNLETAENILPEEVWDLILNKITESSQQWKLGLTCRLFQDVMLKPSKNVWLFQELFPILFDYFEGQSILKCREVCKSWRNRVDSFIENHPTLQPHDDSTHDPGKPIFSCPMQEKGICQYSFNVDDPKDNEAFQSIASHPKNPFIGRKLAVEIWCMAGKTKMPEVHCSTLFTDMERDLFGGLISTLEGIGQHLWHLKIFVVISGYIPTQEKFAFEFISRFILGKMLQLVPNLKSFSVNGVDLEEVKTDMNSAMGSSAPESFYSLPRLVELTLGKGIGTSHTRAETELLVRYHRQLKCVRMASTRSLRWSYFPDLDWANLTELDVGSIFDDTQARDDLERLLHLNVPNLRKLSLCPECLETEYYSDFIRILNELSVRAPHFSVLRLTLNITAARWAEGLENKFASLCAPSCLKSLQIQVVGDVPVTYFHGLLLRFRLAESLNVCFCSESELLNKECGVQNYLAGKKICELHLWTFMPYLDILSLNKNVYTRRHFEEYMVKKSAEVNANSWLMQMD